MTHRPADRDFANASARGRAPEGRESELRERLDASAARERRDAALGLVDRAESGLDRRTVEALGARARRDPNADVRQFAVEALGVAGANPAAIEAALGDDDEWVRAEAAVALSRAVGADAADRLRDALDDEAGPVRRNALIALAKTGEVTTGTLRERLKEDPHVPVREYAAEWLGTHPGDGRETVRLLAAVLARDPAAFVRANAATSLGRIGTDRAVEAIRTQGLEDRSDDVQRAAKRALATARGEDPAQVDLDDPPAPGGGPKTPDAAPADGRGPSGLQSNATRSTGPRGRERGIGDGPAIDHAPDGGGADR